MPCRGRYECCKALLRAGADPTYINTGHDLTLFWAIDGGVEIIKLMHQYSVNMNARTPKDWTPLSYSKAKGKYGATEEHGIYPEVTIHIQAPMLMRLRCFVACAGMLSFQCHTMHVLDAPCPMIQQPEEF